MSRAALLIRLLALVTCLVPAGAADAVSVTGMEVQDARYDLLLQFREARSHTVGVYAPDNAAVDSASLMQKFLPLANFLSVASERVIRFSPEGGSQDLEPLLVHRFYDFVLLPAAYQPRATAHGYQILDLPAPSAVPGPALADFAFFYHPERVSTELVSTLARSLSSVLQEPARHHPLMQGFEYLSGIRRAALHPHPLGSGSGDRKTSQ